MSKERIDVYSLYKATAFPTSTGPPAQDPENFVWNFQFLARLAKGNVSFWHPSSINFETW